MCVGARPSGLRSDPMFRHLLRAWLRRHLPPRARPRVTKPPRRRVILEVERLEDRRVFATIHVVGSPYSVSESDGLISIFVGLDDPSEQTVTVDYRTSSGTATAGSDYLARSGTLVFPQSPDPTTE